MSRRFGIEIEAVGMNRTEVAALLTANGIRCIDRNYTHEVTSYWKVVSDSTVGDRGFELVSPPLDGDEASFELVRKVVRLLNEAGCDVNKNCGLHVHIECSDLSAQHIANIFNRYRDHEAELDRVMPRSRRASNNSMCRSLSRMTRMVARSTARDTAAQQRDRFHKVNLCAFVKYGTIEFRHHGGSLNEAKMINWVRFLQQFVEASRPTHEPRTTTTPTRQLTGKRKSIVELLEFGPATMDQLAAAATTSNGSVSRFLSALRREGYSIVRRGRRYSLDSRPAMTIQQSVATTATTLWSGIDSHISAYYARRAATLASMA